MHGRLFDPVSTEGSAIRGRTANAIVAALALLAVLPIALVVVPGMADLPNHIARHHVLADYAADPALRRWFRVDLRWIGNLGVDLPTIALTPWLGVEAATRLVVALIAPLTVLGIVALGRAVHGRVTASAMLALPFALAQPWAYGFVNYCLAVALALLVAAAWVAWRPAGRALRAGTFAMAALIVWTAHVQGWAVLLLAVAGVELAASRGLADLLRRALRALPLLVPLVPMLAWRGGGPGLLWAYDRAAVHAKIMDFVTVLKGVSRTLDLGVTVAIAAAALVLLASGRRIAPGLGAAALLTVVATLLLPTTLLGSWGADLRLAPVAVMLAVLAIGPAADPRRERALFALGAALFVARVAVVTVEWVRSDAGYARRLALLDQVPRGSRMGYLAIQPDCRTPWVLTPERKLGAYALTRRDAFVNTLFQIRGADLMTIRAAADTHWQDRSQDVLPPCPGDAKPPVPLAAHLAEMAAAGFGTIWIAGRPATPIAPPPGYEVVARTGTDILLRRR